MEKVVCSVTRAEKVHPPPPANLVCLFVVLSQQGSKRNDRVRKGVWWASPSPLDKDLWVSVPQHDGASKSYFYKKERKIFIKNIIHSITSRSINNKDLKVLV